MSGVLLVRILGREVGEIGVSFNWTELHVFTVREPNYSTKSHSGCLTYLSLGVEDEINY